MYSPSLAWFTGTFLNTAEPSLTVLFPPVLSRIIECAAYLDEQQYVQYFGLPLAGLLSQCQRVQQAGSHPLTQPGQTSLQLGHRVHPALAVLHHLREQQGEGAHTHLSFGSAYRPLQNGRLASVEASLHYYLVHGCGGKKKKKKRESE